MFKLSIGVKLGVCAKTISVDGGDFDVFVGDGVGVTVGFNCVCINVTVGNGGEEIAGEGDVGTSVGDGVGVSEGNKATVGLMVGAFVGVRHA